MEYRNLNTIKQKLSLLGFGCMRLPTIDGSKTQIDTKKAESLIDYALKNGVNYFDTAYIYHDGESEIFVGNALKQYDRSSYFLADKLPNWLIKCPSDVDEYFCKQLKKCNAEYFDFYLVHALNRRGLEKMIQNNVYQQLLQKKEEGRIRHLGFSFHDHPDVIKDIVEGRNWDFAQIQLNYLDWSDYGSGQMYNYLTKKGIPVIVMEPLRGGALASLCNNSKSVLLNHNAQNSIASWAMRFCASLDNVNVILSGMNTLDQLKDNINTFTNFKPLSKLERTVLDNAVKEYRKSDTIKCTACRYCMDCNFGVDIPTVFSIYNKFRLSGDAFMFLDEYHGLSSSKKVSSCTSCQMCKSKCPQGLDIPKLLKMVEKRANNIGG